MVGIVIARAAGAVDGSQGSQESVGAPARFDPRAYVGKIVDDIVAEDWGAAAVINVTKGLRGLRSFSCSLDPAKSIPSRDAPLGKKNTPQAHR